MLANNGFPVFGTFVLVLLCCSSEPTTAQKVNMNNVCLLVSEGRLVANDQACNGYYLCQNGRALSRTCEATLYFNKDLQGCVSAQSAPCAAGVRKPCEGQPLDSFAPVPGSCGGYYYCGKNGPVRSNCPTGTNFHEATQQCLWDTTYPCRESGIINDPNNPGKGVNVCDYIENGRYFGSAAHCSGWSKCENNVLQTGFCESPAFPSFNVHKTKCDYEDVGKCEQVTYDPMLIGDISLGGPCTERGKTQGHRICSNYYVCDGTHYVLDSCGRGQFWDTAVEMCVNRLHARNDCDRCAGSRLEYVNAYSTKDCRGYLRCANGVSQGKRNCPKGEFFDEVARTCSGNEPMYGCCNSKFYN